MKRFTKKQPEIEHSIESIKCSNIRTAVGMIKVIHLKTLQKSKNITEFKERKINKYMTNLSSRVQNLK